MTQNDHALAVLVADAMEVFADVYVLLTEDDPPRVDLAANEVQQAHHRFTAALQRTEEPDAQ